MATAAQTVSARPVEMRINWTSIGDAKEEKGGGRTFTTHGAAFFGRPLGRNTDSRPNLIAVRFRHVSDPSRQMYASPFLLATVLLELSGALTKHGYDPGVIKTQLGELIRGNLASLGDWT